MIQPFQLRPFRHRSKDQTIRHAAQCLRPWVVNVALLAGLAGGCAPHKGPTTQSAKANRLNKSVPGQTAPNQPKLEEPKWEATGTPPPDLLAAKTEAYAQSMQTPNPTLQPPLNVPPESTPDKLPTRQNSRWNQTRSKTSEPLAATGSQAVDGSPVGQPPQATAMLAKSTLPSSTLNSASIPNDGPKIMPESADFSADRASSSSSVSEANGKDPLGARLRKRVRQNPRDLVDQLDLQLYEMLSEDPTAELAAGSELPSDDRDLISSIVDGISNFRSVVRQDANMLQPKKLQPLMDMIDRLRSQALLTVNNVTLCNRVDGFGKYEPITPLRFVSGKENAAIVYCEVQNFVPLQDGQMLWKTKLTEQVILFTDTGMIAWSDDKREVTDQCRNRRHDFFAYNIIKLPSTLPIGRYRLMVSVEDKNADRVAEDHVDLQITAK